MHDVFISYSSKDSRDALDVRTFLLQGGCTCWMAPDSIPAGSDYAQAIPKAIREARTFVLILSPSAQDSQWVRRELGKALDEKKTIIPFMVSNFKLNETFDFLLENAQWCHAYTGRGAALKKMLDAVQAQKSAYSHTPPRQTAVTPKQTATAPNPAVTSAKTVTAVPKPTVTTPKPQVTQASLRTYSNSRITSGILYGLTVWGVFWIVTLLLLGVGYLIDQQANVGPGVYGIAAVGMVPVAIFLIAAHRNKGIQDWITDVKHGNFPQKILLWLVLAVGIFWAAVAVIGLICSLQEEQFRFATDQIAMLAVGSGVAALVMLGSWLKKYQS